MVSVQMYMPLLSIVLCIMVISSRGDECLLRYRICSVKDRAVLKKICKNNGGIHGPMLKYAGAEKS
uniref:Uncharacterized protein n=1 Tax=Parascaris equorum TaxID=6256 RepID=A0A914RP42_PAREQ